MNTQYTDEELIKNWEGFTNHNINVNGIEFHYVEGGQRISSGLPSGMAADLVFIP
ncbi:hypothetical protein [uncultured Chryseobacterium sp.]|uniref:hypothetical protein n=1 Tax=uncultured Chryseobacterium sp. TaxID=259322 RepID=UPI0025DE4B02|nr:hypothetical protein [uncultured Chryseobacterium sp.]